MTNHDNNLRIGQGDVLRAKLERASDADIADEYEYRCRRSADVFDRIDDPQARRRRMISAIVAEVDRSGDGPESLKDMLRF